MLASVVEKGLQVIRDDAVQDRILGLALAIPIARLEEKRCGHTFAHRREPCHHRASDFGRDLAGIAGVWTVAATGAWGGGRHRFAMANRHPRLT